MTRTTKKMSMIRRAIKSMGNMMSRKMATIKHAHIYITFARHWKTHNHFTSSIYIYACIHIQMHKSM